MMLDFYSARSKVVHGEYVAIDQGLVDDVENRLRLSIKSFLGRSPEQNHNDLIEHLDLQ